MKKTNVFYQPLLTPKQWEDNKNFFSFMVYRYYDNAKKDFPDCPIGAFAEGDIEEPTVIDDEDDRTITYYVDIPQIGVEEWLNVESFKSREAAIAYAKEHFFADDEGNVSLISQS